MQWEIDLSGLALTWMKFLGDFSPVSNPKEKQLKGYMHDDDGGCKVYLDSGELRELAQACIEAADWLDKRAVDA